MSFGISIGDVLKLCEIAGRVYKNCRDCTGEYKSLTSEARALSNLCEDLSDKFSKIPDSKRKQLQDAYEPCIEVLLELDKLLLHYNSLDTKTKRAWDRLKWDPDKSRTLRDRLTSSTTMLNGFYSSLVLDNQVLILEALGRLELDYRGGHREESVASIEKITSGNAADEDEEDEEAWAQILRDLEDVGVAPQDALAYRDLIVDWLLKAVNEGRLLEQDLEQDSVDSISKNLETTRLAIAQDDPGVHHFHAPVAGLSNECTPASAEEPPSTLSEHHMLPSNSLSPLPIVSRLPESSKYAVSPPLASSLTSANGMSVSRSMHTDDIALPEVGREPMVLGATSSLATLHAPPILPPSRGPSPEVQSRYMPRASSADAPSDTLKEVLPTLQSSLPEVVTNTSSTVLPEAVLHSSQFDTAHTASPVPETSLPPYADDGLIVADLTWIAAQAVAAWNNHDFLSAGSHLEEQLDAVEHGRTVTNTGTQPDRRILRHLIGVCNTFVGNFSKAKSYFESVFNGIYLTSANLDDGDIAAARWLGDACLQLGEYSNTTLAWGVAYMGSVARYGLLQARTRRVGDELRLIDHWLFVFRRLDSSFQDNIDPTTIFRQTHAAEKSDLMATLKQRLYERQGLPGGSIAAPFIGSATPKYAIGARAPISMKISESFLLHTSCPFIWECMTSNLSPFTIHPTTSDRLANCASLLRSGPLISASAWPAQWDAPFSPMDFVQLARYMNVIKTTAMPGPLSERTLSSVTLGDSKKLHYVTKRGSRWLIQAVKEALEEMKVGYTESVLRDSIICTLHQHKHGYAYSVGVEISFKKLQFRSVFGIKISDLKWPTRIFGLTLTQGSVAPKDTSGFRDTLKAILESADNDGRLA